MEKTAKVKSVNQNARSYESKFGKMFIHEIAFDNGDVGEYSSKTEQCKAFTVGAEATYTVEANGTFPDKIKPVMNKGNFGGGNAGGGNWGGNKDSGVITFLSCYSSTCNLHAYSKDKPTTEELIKQANLAFDAAMKHSTVTKEVAETK